MSDSRSPGKGVPRWLWLVSVVGSVVLISAGISIGGGVGWWLVGCTGVGWAFTGGQLLWARWLSRSTLSQPGRTTGRSVQPVPAHGSLDKRSWVGGGAVPGPMGFVSASWPLVVLELQHGVVTVRLRLRLFGARAVRMSRTDDATVFAARGWFGARGVGIRGMTGTTAYLWTRDRATVLSVLAAAGFQVSWDEQRIRYW